MGKLKKVSQVLSIALVAIFIIGVVAFPVEASANAKRMLAPMIKKPPIEAEPIPVPAPNPNPFQGRLIPIPAPILPPVYYY